MRTGLKLNLHHAAAPAVDGRGVRSRWLLWIAISALTLAADLGSKFWTIHHYGAGSLQIMWDVPTRLQVLFPLALLPVVFGIVALMRRGGYLLYRRPLGFAYALLAAGLIGNLLSLAYWRAVPNVVPVAFLPAKIDLVSVGDVELACGILLFAVLIVGAFAHGEQKMATTPRRLVVLLVGGIPLVAALLIGAASEKAYAISDTRAALGADVNLVHCNVLAEHLPLQPSLADLTLATRGPRVVTLTAGASRVITITNVDHYCGGVGLYLASPASAPFTLRVDPLAGQVEVARGESFIQTQFLTESSLPVAGVHVLSAPITRGTVVLPGVTASFRFSLQAAAGTRVKLLLNGYVG